MINLKDVELEKLNLMRLEELVKIMGITDLCFKGCGNGQVKLINQKEV